MSAEISGRPPDPIGCGCCRGVGDDPNRDRCTCHIHQDISQGLRARKCPAHAIDAKAGGLGSGRAKVRS